MILVTGGAGFIGSHLCATLVARGAQVACIDDLSTGRRENVAALASGGGLELLVSDVCDAPDMDVDAVFHLACVASPPVYQREPIRTLRTAVEGTRRALEIAERTGARLLLASTSEVYGTPAVHPQPESYWGNVSTTGPRAAYDEGKRCAEALVSSYARERGADVRIARIFNTYGPGMQRDDGRVVPSFCARALRGEPIEIFGDGTQTRSFCYVTDLVDGLLALMATDDDPGPVNLGNPDEQTIADLAALVAELAGSRAPARYAPLPEHDPPHRRPDISLAREVLGWTPRVSLRDGLVATLAALRDSEHDRTP